MTTVVSRDSAAHYSWGGVCDGWRLLDGTNLSVIEERIPPGAGERLHAHAAARQLFYVLSGRLTIDIADETHVLGQGDAVHIEPGSPHRVKNAGADDAWFLVISSPTTRGDRTNLE